MIKYLWNVELTNKTYKVYAFKEKEAIILAQYEAIQEGRPYDLVSISVNETWD